MLVAYASVSSTDTGVLGTKLKHCFHHDKPHQSDQGKKHGKTSSDHSDSAYDSISKENQ